MRLLTVCLEGLLRYTGRLGVAAQSFRVHRLECVVRRCLDVLVGPFGRLRSRGMPRRQAASCEKDLNGPAASDEDGNQPD